MSFSKYDTFLKVLELNSFSKAAEELGFTQSTVSQTVSQMESEFGFKLLNRKRNSLTLTDEGKEILPYIQDAVNCERKIEAKLAEINGIFEGTVNVGTYHTISYSWMPQIIREFNRIYSGVNINHVHGNAILLKELLDSGRVDCCLMDILPDEQMKKYFIHKEEYKVIVPKNSEESRKSNFNLSVLDKNGVQYVKEGKGLILFNGEGEGELSGQINSYTTDENVLLTMVEKGLGVGIIAEMALKRNSYEVEIKDISEPLYRELGLITKDINKLSPAARTFIEHVVNNNYYL